MLPTTRGTSFVAHGARLLGLAAAALCCASHASAQAQSPLYETQGAAAFSVALSDGDLLTFRAAGPGSTSMLAFQPSSPPISGGAVLTIRGENFASPAISPPSTNSFGDIAFTDFDSGASALFIRRGGGVLLTIDGSNFRSSSVGSDGTVFVNSIGPAGAELLAYPPGGNHITIVGIADGVSPVGRAAMTSSSNTVLTRVTSPAGEALFAAAPGGWRGTIPDLPLFHSFSDPAASGELAVFTATDDASGLRGVFASPLMGGDVLTIRGENFLSPGLDFSEPGANDAGAVVFARLGPSNGGVERIEYGDLFGSEVRTLVALGDELLGSTITGLTFNPDGLNQASDFAYGAQLADGRSVIMIANNVPAPGSLVLIAIGSAACLRRRASR